MINGISWTEYFTYLATALIIYYVAVLFLYYRTDLLQFVAGKIRVPIVRTQVSEPELSKVNSFNSPIEEDETLFDQANRLMSELQGVFQNEFIKEELIKALQMKLREYTGLKETPFRISINNFIECESEKRSIPLSEEDLRVLW